MASPFQRVNGDPSWDDGEGDSGFSLPRVDVFLLAFAVIVLIALGIWSFLLLRATGML